MEKEKGNGCFHIDGKKIHLQTGMPRFTIKPGVYELKSSLVEHWLQPSHSNHDTLLDLPGTEYELVLKEMQLFLKEETKAKFKKYGFVYKNNILLYGKPGTGKTCIVNRVAKSVVDAGGVVIYNPSPSMAKKYVTELQEIQPGLLTLVIFEEFDDTLKRDEHTFLELLDGEAQQDNTFFIATTNFIKKIPERIVRPGRFPTVLEVGSPSAEARRFFLREKMGLEGKELTYWVENTVGFTIDELKETVRAVVCFGKDFTTVVNHIRRLSKSTKKTETETDLSSATLADSMARVMRLGQ